MEACDDTKQLESQDLIRFKLIISYNGTRFKGFQRQSSGQIKSESSSEERPRKKPRAQDPKTPLTVQECIENGLEQYSGLDRVKLRFRFAGRTDGGVHARGQVAAVSLPSSICGDIDSSSEFWKLRKAINSRLPNDISVEDVTSLRNNPEFDPRRDAISKEYSYTLKYRRKVFQADGTLLPLCTSGPNCVRTALDPNTMWVSPWALDDSNMVQYCEKLSGNHDYSAFVHKRARKEQSNVLTVHRFEREILSETAEDAPIVIVRFRVEAKGFRRSMVRNLIGFLVDLCRGHVEASLLDATIWDGTDQSASCVHSAPPFGLCLEKVTYGP